MLCNRVQVVADWKEMCEASDTYDKQVREERGLRIVVDSTFGGGGVRSAMRVFHLAPVGRVVHVEVETTRLLCRWYC